MKILFDGYIDRNLGDDLMLTLAANALAEHELYITSDKLKIDNVTPTDKRSGFDLYLRVTGSGFLLHNRLGALYRLREMRAEKKYAHRRAVIGCSLDPFPSRAAERVIRRQLSGYDFITVRDSYSRDYIAEHVHGVRCEQYSDIVFSLSDSMIPTAQSEGLLGITAHNAVSPETLARAADAYIEETSRGVMLLCLNMGQENDERAAHKIYSLAKNKTKIDIVRYNSIQQILTDMKRCSCIVAARLHAAVLAARMGIPFVPIAYSDKMQHVMANIDYTGTVFDVNPDSDSLIKNILSPEQFTVNESVIASAKQHITRLNDFLKG